eukprot:1872670-Prymnesium_polylepis.1
MSYTLACMSIFAVGGRQEEPHSGKYSASERAVEPIHASSSRTNSNFPCAAHRRGSAAASRVVTAPARMSASRPRRCLRRRPRGRWGKNRPLHTAVKLSIAMHVRRRGQRMRKFGNSLILP